MKFAKCCRRCINNDICGFQENNMVEDCKDYKDYADECASNLIEYIDDNIKSE